MRRQSTLVIVIANQKEEVAMGREVKGIEAPFSQIKAAEPLHLLGKKKGLCFNYLDQRFSSVL